MTSEQLAWKIRRHGVEMTHLSGGSHIGAILSVADIMGVLYAEVLKYDPKNLDWDERDRFILSKGHAGASVYVVLGDGECDEGSVWEAALFANHFRLNNLVAIVDHNHMQSLDFQENTLEIEDFGTKWKAFAWNVVEIDGNNHEELRAAFRQVDEYTKDENHKPTVIIANTIKGYGVSFMQNDILWHYRFPHDGWEYDMAVNELHEKKPEGVEDVYTPNGVENPTLPTAQDDIGNDHTFSKTWQTTYPEKMRRVEARSGTDEREHKL